jgi:hypothetical protein
MSYLDFVQMKLFEFIYLFFNNVHNYIYFLLKVKNHLNQKKIEYHYSITFQ